MAFDFISPQAMILKGMGLSYVLMPEAVGAAAPKATKPKRVLKKPEKPAPFGEGFRPISPSEWPDVLRERLAQTKGRVVWTYAGLARDMECDNEGRDARKEGLAKMLKELHHPKGTHAFWPEEDPALFWSGVVAMRARAVVLMGSGALKALLPGKAAMPGQIMRLRGISILVTESPERNPMKNLDFLKRSLAPFTAQAPKMRG